MRARHDIKVTTKHSYEIGKCDAQDFVLILTKKKMLPQPSNTNGSVHKRHAGRSMAVTRTQLIRHGTLVEPARVALFVWTRTVNP